MPRGLQKIQEREKYFIECIFGVVKVNMLNIFIKYALNNIKKKHIFTDCDYCFSIILDSFKL